MSGSPHPSDTTWMFYGWYPYYKACWTSSRVGFIMFPFEKPFYSPYLLVFAILGKKYGTEVAILRTSETLIS